MMQGPPPPMMMRPMVSRTRLIVVVGVGLGLFLLFLGAAIINAGHTVIVNPTAEQTANNTNLVTVWGPTILSLGLFFLVGGLLFGVTALGVLILLFGLFSWLFEPLE